MIRLAREEGRRMGIQEGLTRGRDLGIREGRMMVYAEARSSVRSDEYYAESRTPSPVDFDQPSQARRISSPVKIPPAPEPAPVPPIPPVVPNHEPPSRPPSQYSGAIQPTIVHNASRSPRHIPIDIPPDGYIPELGLDSIIRLPPPHEFCLLCNPPHSVTITYFINHKPWWKKMAMRKI